MSKILVVMYSYTGTGRRLARRLSAARAWPLAEVRDAEPRSGARGYARCLLDSLLRRRPEIIYTGPAPEAFDAVVLVSPIWGFRLAGPMRSFVAAHAKVLHDAAVISVMDGSGAPHAVAEVARLLGRPPVMSAAFVRRELDAPGLDARLDAFAQALTADEDRRLAQRAAQWSPQTA